MSDTYDHIYKELSKYDPHGQLVFPRPRTSSVPSGHYRHNYYANDFPGTSGIPDTLARWGPGDVDEGFAAIPGTVGKYSFNNYIIISAFMCIVLNAHVYCFRVYTSGSHKEIQHAVYLLGKTSRGHRSR